MRSRRWCYIVLITANAHATKQASSQAYMPCISVVPELHWLAFCDRFASGLLRDMGLPSTPQQASATCFPVHHTSASLRRKPVPPCRRSKFTLRQQLPRRGSSFQGGVPQLRSNKQATGALLHFRMGLKRLRNFYTKLQHSTRALFWHQDTGNYAVAMNHSSRPQQVQVSACSGQSCRDSGIMPKTSTWETSGSQPALICVCGGVVISVRAGFRTNG